MYPILSALRRMALHHVYVTPDQVQMEDGKYVLKTRHDVSCFDIAKKAWQPGNKHVTLFELRAVGADALEVATSLSVAETKIYFGSEIDGSEYTLLMLPEVEQQVGKKYARTLRIGIVQGVHAANPEERRVQKPKKREPVHVTFAALKLPGLQEF